MDRSWIKLSHRYCAEYVNGLREFIRVARGQVDSLNRTRCPCRNCINLYSKTIDVVEDHLFRYGMHKQYTQWEHHGERYEPLINEEGDNRNSNDIEDDEPENVDGVQELLEDMREGAFMDNYVSLEETSTIHDPSVAQGETFSTDGPDVTETGSEKFEQLLRDSQCQLYPGCEKYSKLSFILKLFHIKTINGISNKAFNMLLELFKEALPSGETLPKSFYEAKSIMRDLGLGYIPIHACKYDCVLFWKEYEDCTESPKCMEPRYKYSEGKRKNVPQKVLRYFPLKPRLQRLFMSRKTAEDMRWHKEKRADEGNVLRHPADSKAWDDFNKKHEWFANDPRNIRLGLASDGFNPFGNMSNSYSMWPVMLMPYNLPPWKCMKEPFFFMSLLIPGPKSPGNDIDVYLRPLIDELKELWEDGVVTYDAFSRQNFKLHAAVLWTINDFPAYGNLSGWTTKGFMACPTCNKETSSMYLKHGHKICYMAHRRFLHEEHVWRKRYKQFDGTKEGRPKPKSLTGDDLLQQLNHVEDVKFGKAPSNKKRKRTSIELNWSKNSIFFELPYWKTLMLRHNLDVMHIEKNICDNILGTLMNIDGKSKDSVKARMDLEAMGIRKELHLIPNGDKFLVPTASFTLPTNDRKSFCDWLKSIKFPDGYASNISRCVNVSEGKISGLKSHDCHVLLQRLLPIAIRGYLDKDVYTALVELSIFFKELCCKKLKLEVLEELERDIAIILCKLERIFPPSFFDVMVHLAIHLPYEAIIAGPVQYRWMYPIERFLGKLKKFVRNKARPEGSIAEAYIDSECLTFCSMYLEGIETRYNREERNYDGAQEKKHVGLSVFDQNVRPLGSSNNIQIMDMKTLDKVRWYVLNNCQEILPYLEEHISELERQNVSNIQQRHEQEFAKWFQERMQRLRNQNSLEATDALYSLACGPDPRIKWYSGAIVNGIRFHTIERERYRKTQNSGMVVKGEHHSEEIDFYGVLTDVIRLDYIKDHHVFLFKCDWWDVGDKRLGIQRDCHFTSINMTRNWYKDDPFVLASQVEQVFYVKDSKLRGDWHVVQKTQPRNSYDVLEMEAIEDSEAGATMDDEAYQQDESFQIDGIIEDDDVENEELEPFRLIREDVNPDCVNADLIQENVMLENVDATFIDDEEIDLEDDTLMDYWSGDEVISDYDTDIET